MINTFKMYGSLFKLLKKYIFLPQGTIYLKSERMNTTASSLLKLIGTFAKPWWWRLKYSKPSLRQSILSCLGKRTLWEDTNKCFLIWCIKTRFWMLRINPKHRSGLIAPFNAELHFPAEVDCPPRCWHSDANQDFAAFQQGEIFHLFLVRLWSEQLD